MGSISDYLENELLDHIFNAAYTPAATIYVGLSTADPLDDASGLAEPSGAAYARQSITFDAAASRAISQSALIIFPAATGSWGTITHYALFDALSGGNLLGSAALSSSKSIISGDIPSIDAAEINISFKTLAAKGTGENISDYLANKLLDFAFRNQAFPQPDTYVAYATADLTDSDTGSTITEPGGGVGYARKQVNINGGASPTWNLASSGQVDNADTITQAAVTGDWGILTAVAVIDALTAGNLLFYYNDVTDRHPTNGDTVRIIAGNFVASLT